MTTVTLRMPQDVVDSLKAVAPLRGFSGYQALLKSYVSEGLRRDEAEHAFGPQARLMEALKRRGIPQEVIDAAAAEVASHSGS